MLESATAKLEGAVRTRKRYYLVAASLMMSAAGVLWDTLYLHFDEPLAAAFPFAYSRLFCLWREWAIGPTSPRTASRRSNRWSVKPMTWC